MDNVHYTLDYLQDAVLTAFTKHFQTVYYFQCLTDSTNTIELPVKSRCMSCEMRPGDFIDKVTDVPVHFIVTTAHPVHKEKQVAHLAHMVKHKGSLEVKFWLDGSLNVLNIHLHTKSSELYVLSRAPVHVDKYGLDYYLTHNELSVYDKNWRD